MAIDFFIIASLIHSSFFTLTHTHTSFTSDFQFLCINYLFHPFIIITPDQKFKATAKWEKEKNYWKMDWADVIGTVKEERVGGVR